MQLRKDRVHHHGKTNKDEKSQTKNYENEVTEGRSRVKSLFLSSTKNIPKQTEQHGYIDPLIETQLLAQKKQKHHKIGYPRYAQLDESLIGKQAFCGDSNIQYREDVSKSQQFESLKQLDKSKLANQKIEENAKVIQETQLVNLENKVTHEGKVDLEKVRDIKRSLRRRYANRKNFQKIFNSWDEDANGAISVKNLYNMVKRMGININMDEAKVLLASADKDESNDLGMDEFMDLIFNDQDLLNRNIQQLNQDKSKAIKLLIKDAKLARQRKHHNQINIILKNRQIQLGQWLHEADENGKGQINYKKFEEIIRKLRIDEKILSNEDIKNLAQNFTADNQLIDCQQFINHLKQFQLKEEFYDDPYLKQQEQQQIQLTGKGEDKIHIFDVTKVNGWHLERMRYRANNMLNRLKKYLPDKERFSEQFQQLNDQQVNVDNFQAAITKFLNNINENHHKFDLEALLSIMQFNQYKVQSKDEILRIIYDENDEDFFERAQQQRKQPPPPHQPENIEVPKENQTEEFGGFYTKKFGLSSTMPNANKQLMDVLRKVDNGIFNKQEKQLKIFKEFDLDQDGYVSQNDLKQKMQHLLNKEEINVLISYLDPNNKGFTNFTEFSQKIRNGMTILDENGNQVINVNTQPTKTALLAASSFLPELNSSIEQFKKPFRASKNRSDYKPLTRYGFTPAKQDTFQHFVPFEKSGLWASAETRFSKNREEYIIEDKNIKAFRQEQKLERIRSYQQEIRNRIKSQEDRLK